MKSDNNLSIKCSICNSGEVAKIINWKEYAIWNCKNCSLTFTVPLPSDEFLSDFYQGFLFNLPKGREIDRQIIKRKRELRQLFLLDENTKLRKYFLDYGGGTGSVYKAAIELGLQVYYHDLDIEAREYVQRKHGLKDEFIVEDIQNTELKFDFIFSDNVIEHVKDPVKFINHLGNVLNTGGTLIIKTPHARNSEAYFYPLITLQGYFFKALSYNSFPAALKSYFFRFWHCDPPRHLFAFSAKNLRLAASLAGFSEAETEISYYRIPLWKYSITTMVFTFYKAKSNKAKLFRLLLIPIIPFELISKLIQFILRKMNLLTPGGIVLKIVSKG